MLKRILKLKLIAIFSLITTALVKYLFIDDPEVHKFIKVGHLFLTFERYFSGVGYNYFHRDNIISNLGFSKKIVNEENIDKNEILKFYEVPSLIDNHKIEIKIIVNKKIFNEKNYPIKFPTVIYVHGGGYVFRGIETNFYKNFTDLGFIFIYVYYRLAPEYKFPFQIEDNFSVLKFISEINNIETLNNDNLNNEEIRKIFGKIDLKDIILMGDSAGGNLIGSLAILAKIRGLTDKINISKQIFIFPGMFYVGDLPSRTKYKNWYLLSEKEVVWFVDKYINDKKDINNKLISPLLYEDDILRNMPESYFILAERDPLFSEGELYKIKLMELGNSVISKSYPAEHGFIFFEGIIPEADLAIKDLMEYIYNSYSNYIKELE